jgi:transposase
MTRRKTDPLRPLTEEERRWLGRISRSRAEPEGHVARARALLAVADGRTYTEAAALVGRRVGDTVAAWVRSFNRAGLGALESGHGGGPPARYGVGERTRILSEFRRPPDREQDGTVIWSVATFGRALRRAADGLAGVSDDTVWRGLRASGLAWQKDRSWCETGVVLRKRKAGVVEVIDPDAAAKKS